MFNRVQFKANAKSQIKGNIGIIFVCYLIMALISGTVIGSLAAPALALGMATIFLGLINGKKAEVGDLFKGFNYFGKALWLQIITGFFLCLWSMLFFIPGIIKMYSYSMAQFVLADNPNLTARQALAESKRITKGHKGELFVMDLSFIGWYMLIGITFGIAAIYVGPYVMAAKANAYNALKAN